MRYAKRYTILFTNHDTNMRLESTHFTTRERAIKWLNNSFFLTENCDVELCTHLFKGCTYWGECAERERV